MNPTGQRRPRIALSGGSGFVGGATLRALVALGLANRTRLLVHDRSPVVSFDGAAGTSVRTAVERRWIDVGDPTTLAGACTGMDILLHCASSLGAGPEHSRRIDQLGTEHLVQEARRAGVGRLVYVSTCAVYGPGTYRNAAASTLPIAPGSRTSSARAAAEQSVLQAGGIVLRPHLTVGPGDRWVIPAIHRLRTALGGWVQDARQAHQSVIGVDDLGRLVVGLGTARAGGLSRRIYHAAAEPVTSGDLFDAVDHLMPPPAIASGPPLTRVAAERRLSTQGLPSHDLHILCSENWFAGEDAWADTGLRPTLGFRAAVHEAELWYRSRPAFV